MKQQHPSDEVLQDYAQFDIAETAVSEHIGDCKKCQAAIANYRLLFAAIAQVPKPVFDFNTTELVITKLPAPTAPVATNRIPQTIMIAAFVAGSLYYFRKFFVTMAGGISMAVLLIIAAAALIATVYRAFIMYKRYEKQIDQLNFY